ncbi:uncharacterized protein J3R85_013001 [Psidium guajava]|nr:uncharacterized protein J3R85_013001 [Psidium guajava]
MVIKLCMDCEKARSKAMKIAADAHGVISVAVEIEKNHLVVTGSELTQPA